MESEQPDSGFVSVRFIFALWDPGLGHASYTRVSGSQIWSSCLLCRGRMPRPVGWKHICEIDMEYFSDPNLSVAVAKCWYLGFEGSDRISVCFICIANVT